MSKFTDVALQYFRDDVGPGQLQRIDGVRCFSPLPRFWFWHLRLKMMVRRGQLTARRTRSIWKSCDGMPAYGLGDPS